MSHHTPDNQSLEKLLQRAYPELKGTELDAADQRLQAYLALCLKIYRRRKQEGTWPFPDELPEDSTFKR